ncbi:non-ribosomal peptide synthetase [Actinomadura harenae]|uniref:Amino acid adenylation domain-containing protein n=1 Tax=Actinomadura harenae TaxID=2483351 RepID=A0A3M2LTB6_9ACTN|nr:non-ribosomal peptide synthetase [Actinomadura harenae]RMI40729.1 amino acid adenylation domain-containing protein [Actinomadura harenae]
MAAAKFPAQGRPAVSLAQEGIWFLDRLGSGASALVLRRGYRVTGGLDAAALRDAWRAVLVRHQVLRTGIVPEDGVPIPHAVPVLADGPVDLATGPVVALTVTRTGPREHRVTLTAHRAVADADSLAFLAEDLSATYARPGAPGRAARPFADYVAWEREARDASWWRGARRYWSRELTVPPPAPPFDRDPGTDVPPSAVPFDWGPETAAMVASLAREHGTTPVVVVLAAFQSLLLRYNGGGAVPVMVPMDARPAGFERTVGPLTNPVVVCGRPEDEPTFAAMVAAAARSYAEAREHRLVPFTEVVRVTGADRDRIPWSDATLVPPGPEARLVLGDALVEPDPVADAEPADLCLSLDDLDASVRGRLGHRADPSSPAPAALPGHLRTFLRAAAGRPGALVADLPFEDRDRTEIVARSGGTADPDAPREPVHAMLGRHPDADAMTWPGGRLTYRDLLADATALAARLRAAGAGGAPADGAPVAIRMPHGPAQLTASIAAHLAGGHVLWFGSGDAGERGRTVLAELKPACLVTETPDDPLERWFQDHLGGTLVHPGHGDGAEPIAPPPVLDLDRTAYVAYTSGSTGKPKGIAHTHGALAQFATWMARAWGIGRGSRVALWVTPEHDPSLCEVFATLAAGGTLCVVPDRIRLNPEALLGWLADEGVTFLQTVPSFAAELLRAARDREGGWPRTLDRVVLMGEALSGALVNGLREAAPHARILNVYGPTETIAATWYEVAGPVPATVPIGRPIPGRRILVLDGRDRPCPAGVTGEIVILGPYAAAGYVGGDDASAFRPPPGTDAGTRCYRTGDLGRWRWDGVLEFRGRRDHQVKVGGNRVELADVETELAAHPSVRECAVVPVTGAHGLVTHLLAHVVPVDPAAADPDTWRAHLHRRFGASMRLIAFHTLGAALPRNIAGKVDRLRLPDPARARARRGRAPRTAAERELAGLWRDLLGAAPATAEDGFLAMGGHSLLLPVLAERIRDRFGVAVSLRDCLTHSSLAGMAALLEPDPARGSPTKRVRG